ncbi:MAG: nitrogenase molybdenum-iron protein alpha chain [Leptonema illini]|uniref:Nitrogenase protein alpha chain n=1 Tax=Leptonema illini TaxID=183 RepID=A0A833LYN4_9LEPT|nr:MAG: nitrogenase molybdenum-iron protein alpha chain [Leptonema illini]
MSNFAKTKEILESIISEYPDKAGKKRAAHLAVKETTVDEQGNACSTCAVKSNVKSIPGVMTARGCAYAGSKGVVWGPVRDMVHISHGPVGCGYYSWSTRRNLASGKPGVNNFVPFQFTTDYQEKDIVYGGAAKLEEACNEIHTLFPEAKGISIQSECPIGLIGDDIEASAKKITTDTGLTIVPVRCEGFRGVSQSLGHHIANDAVRDYVLGKGTLPDPGPYDVAVLGDYNIGGDAWASRVILEEMGLRVVAMWSGDGDLETMKITHAAKINLIHCYRSMNYIARHMEEAYGIPWLEYNFFGPTRIEKSIREIASKFDATIQEKAEAVIAKYRPAMDAIVAKYRPRLEGKKVMLYVGGLRPRHVIGAYEDLGMEVIGTGYEFGHADDYQRTMEYVKDGTVIYDDVTEFELETLVDKIKPDLVGSGIKEKYVFQKMGVPFRQMHSWDYSGPYHGYEGFGIFARDMDMAVNSPTWNLVKSPF